MGRHAFTEQYRKAVEGKFPVPNRHGPFPTDVVQV